MADGRASAPGWPWDLVGLPWVEAQQILQARGHICTTVVTAPPNRPEGLGELRVVAERSRPEGFELVLAYREYQRGGPWSPAADGQGRDRGAC